MHARRMRRAGQGGRAWWWLPLPLPTTSTPDSASAMCGEAGVKSSSHVSAASTASSHRSAASPIGQLAWPVAARNAGGRPCSSVSRGRFQVAKYRVSLGGCILCQPSAALCTRHPEEPAGKLALGAAPVVAVVGQRQLGAQQQHSTVQQVCAAVVAHAAVDDRHADVAQDTMRRVAGQQLCQALPAVLNRVQLLEVVLAAVARHLQLRPAHHTMGMSDSKQ